MSVFEQGPSSGEGHQEKLQQLRERLETLEGEEIASGSYHGDTRYHVALNRPQTEVVVEQGVAVFEVPVNLFLSNSGEYRTEDTMILLCAMRLSDGAVQVQKKSAEDGSLYAGELDEWYADAVNYIESLLSGKPKTREELELDRYLRW